MNLYGVAIATNFLSQHKLQDCSGFGKLNTEPPCWLGQNVVEYSCLGNLSRRATTRISRLVYDKKCSIIGASYECIWSYGLLLENFKDF